jgi:hypothetical protein
MGRDPNRSAPPEPPRFWRAETVRVGFWIMWPGVCLPARRLSQRLDLTGERDS